MVSTNQLIRLRFKLQAMFVLSCLFVAFVLIVVIYFSKWDPAVPILKSWQLKCVGMTLVWPPGFGAFAWIVDKKIRRLESDHEAAGRSDI